VVDIRRLVKNGGNVPEILGGPFSSRPAASSDTRFLGRLYVSDEGGLYRDAGSSWIAISGGGGGGASAATPSALGTVKISTAAVDAANPIAVGDNDSRMTNARAPSGTAGGQLAGTYPNPTLLGSAVRGHTNITENTFTGNDTIDEYDLGYTSFRVTTAVGGNPAASGAGWPKENSSYLVETFKQVVGTTITGIQRIYHNSTPTRTYVRQVSGTGTPAWGAWQAGRIVREVFYLATVASGGTTSAAHPITQSGDIVDISATMDTPPGTSGTSVRLRRRVAGAASTALTATAFTIPTATAPAAAKGGLSLSFANAIAIDAGDDLHLEVTASDATTPGGRLAVVVTRSV
jgi:hypothetical protein